MSFYRFWMRTGLKIPPRLTSFHDYMGKLRTLKFVGEVREGGKIVNKSLRPEIPELSNYLIHADKSGHLPNSSQPIPAQLTDVFHTFFPDNSSLESTGFAGFAEETSKGADPRDLSFVGHQGEGDKGAALTGVEAWLDEYRRYDESES